jgi:hypothetical protein
MADWETYFSFEDDADGPVLSRSWAVETEPPFRAGRGVRLRLGSRAVHLGVARPTRDDDPLRVVGSGVDVTPEDIGKWTLDEVATPEDADAGADPVEAGPAS